jgi:uncharacterized membrane protein YhaH (DUF805 family)
VLFLAPAALVGVILKNQDNGMAAEIILLLLLTVLLWASVACSVRRLHDRNKDGTWYLLSLVPAIGPVWLLIECGFLPGTPGVNDFGGRGSSVLDLPR